MTRIKIEEDKQFLQAQREKWRRGYMGAIHKNLTQLDEGIRKRAFEQEQRKH